MADEAKTGVKAKVKGSIVDDGVTLENSDIKGDVLVDKRVESKTTYNVAEGGTVKAAEDAATVEARHRARMDTYETVKKDVAAGFGKIRENSLPGRAKKLGQTVMEGMDRLAGVTPKEGPQSSNDGLGK